MRDSHAGVSGYLKYVAGDPNLTIDQTVSRRNLVKSGGDRIKRMEEKVNKSA